MRFVVTGGAGFIGSNIVKSLIQNKHDVVVIDNLHTGKKENLDPIYENIEFHLEDIRNKEKLQKIIKNCDGIFHQAALTVVPESFEIPDEYNDVNVTGTKNIFEIAKEKDLKVVYASSSSIYGNVKKIPISENFPKNPINPYGKTKLDTEFLAEKFSSIGCSIIGLRYFNVYGIGQTGSYAGVITKFMNALSEKKSPIIFGDGSQIRDFIFVKDVAKANLSVMDSDINSTFLNVGTGKTISIKKLAEIMIHLYELDLTPIFQNPLPGDVAESQAQISQIESLTGWKYETELEDGLRSIINK
tara:strand:+ start:1319 stop:2221 length:903 start_codon:yes stop_codon:yes gene_type:complete